MFVFRPSPIWNPNVEAAEFHKCERDKALDVRRVVPENLNSSLLPLTRMILVVAFLDGYVDGDGFLD